jgi:hypothetical protein
MLKQPVVLCAFLVSLQKAVLYGFNFRDFMAVFENLVLCATHLKDF